jgi:hypothetical protein
MNNKPYFLFLKTLLSLFVDCELALRPGDQFLDYRLEDYRYKEKEMRGRGSKGEKDIHVFSGNGQIF